MKLALLAFTLLGLTAGDPPSRGEALFLGRASVSARLAGSEDELAPAATVCSNCHGPDGAGVAEAGAYGSDIRGSTLTRRKSRRGGPPSAYTLESFRLALRSGHDPAHVVLVRAMPRYTISDADTSALWAYLMTLGSR